MEAFRALSEAGADCVGGHHPHVPQGLETRRGRLIPYSLGNFAFFQPPELLYRRTGFCLSLEARGGRLASYGLHPYRITAAGLRALMGSERRDFRTALRRVSAPFGTAQGVAGGLAGLGVVVLFGLFIWRGLRISYKAPDMLGTLIGAGLTIWIGVEAFMNMSVIVGLFPFAGNALPFVSAGGSNLIVTLAAVGILMNIARQGNGRPQTQTQTNVEERRSFSATSDLRRRNGRRGISRTGRS